MSELQVKNYSLDKPDRVVEFAVVLRKVIEEQKLFTVIQGKKYPHVEAWQFCGMSFGVVAVVKNIENVSDENNLKFRCEVELKRLDNGEFVGSGISICSNKESSKKYFDEYALMGMAQTRAISRAYRNTFGFILKLSGYEATPVEEAEFTESFGTSENKKEEIKNAIKNT
jgi:hypothetical protein